MLTQHPNAVRTQALMDAVGGDLGKRAGDISEYSLNASLDAATRASNAQYDDPDVMDRLRIRLDKATGVETGAQWHSGLQMAATAFSCDWLFVCKETERVCVWCVCVYAVCSLQYPACLWCVAVANASTMSAICLLRFPGAVEATTLPGWDVFVLHYEMDQPLSSIIHRDAANGYLRVFRLLWGMRRVEHSLNGAWKQMTLTERTLGQLRTTARRNGLGVPGLDGVWGELRHAHRVLSEMAHFATNMQTYLHFEVMEASWEDFCRDSRCAAPVDFCACFLCLFFCVFLFSMPACVQRTMYINADMCARRCLLSCVCLPKSGAGCCPPAHHHTGLCGILTAWWPHTTHTSGASFARPCWATARWAKVQRGEQTCSVSSRRRCEASWTWLGRSSACTSWCGT